MMSQRGRVDGEIGRVERKYENLIKVTEPLFSEDLVVFTMHDDLDIAGPKSLASHRVGIVKGFSW